MLSCFPFSYSPLKDDEYNHLFIGQEDQISEEAEDNCLNISLSSVDSIGQTPAPVKLTNLVNTDSVLSQSSSPLTPNSDNIKIPVPLPRTFRKPDALTVDSCLRSDSIPVSNTQTTSASLTSAAKSSLLRLGFHRSKGTEHLQQEAIRKSNQTNSSALLSQRYIKLPTKSVNRFCDSTHNTINSNNCNKNSNNIINNSNNKSKLILKSNSSLSSKKSISAGISSISSPSLPKPPVSKTLGLNSLSTPSCNSSPNLSAKPPPRPLTSHPGLNSGASPTIMPRQRAQLPSVNASDMHSSAINDNNVCNVSSNTTRETSLTTSASNSTITTCTSSASSIARSGTQSASTSSTSGSGAADWNRSGTFINKPARGWLHPDQQIAETGISYAVRYVGCLGINTSMKSLDFDTRSQIAKECITRVCEIARIKTPDKKRRPEKRITRMLGENANMECAGADVNLVITSSYLHLTVVETGENIAKHEMPNISFASGGDADTLDFVAYVAKDHRYGRACFVIEAGTLAQDVITTVGQAFELRFKEFLKRGPRSASVNERLDSTLQNGSNTNSNANSENNNSPNGRIEDRDYYNDLPGKIPPEAPAGEPFDKTITKEDPTLQRLPTAAPRSCLKKTSVNELNSSPNLIDLNDNQDETVGADTDPPSQENNRSEHQYVNCATNDSNDLVLESIQTPIKDPFDMQPFNNALAAVAPEPIISSNPSASHSKSTVVSELQNEDWFHGPISRKESECLVIKDGDFLVRESQGSSGQYVLTGMQSDIRKHLLLVDPEGVVRTKDKTFESVSHLINYHRNNGLPIISAESALVLRNAVLVKR